MRAPSTYPRGSVFLDGSTCTSQGVSPRADSQEDASGSALAETASAPATSTKNASNNASSAEAPQLSHASSLSSSDKSQQPSADALRLRAARAAAAASTPSYVARPAAASTSATITQSASPAYGSNAPDNDLRNATAKVASNEATVLERRQHSKHRGSVANTNSGEHSGVGASSKARADPPVAEPPVVVDDSDSVSLSLRPGEKAVIPRRLRYR